MIGSSGPPKASDYSIVSQTSKPANRLPVSSHR